MPKRIWGAARRSLAAPAVRYPPDPRAIFLLGMCVVSGVPLIFANATPNSIADQLEHDWQVITWGIGLTGGALLTLIGALRQSVNGVIAEQIGSIALGFACLIFAVAIWDALHWKGSVVMLFVLGFGIASLWRWGQLQAYLNAVEEIAQVIRDADEGDPDGQGA